MFEVSIDPCAVFTQEFSSADAAGTAKFPELAGCKCKVAKQLLLATVEVDSVSAKEKSELPGESSPFSRREGEVLFVVV